VAATGALTVVITALMFAGDYLDQAWADPIVAWTYPPALTAHRCAYILNRLVSGK